MMANALFPSLWHWFEILIPTWTKSDATRPTTEPDEDGWRNQRHFINEMISRNPHAFSSDLDVHNMMTLFPEQF